MRKALLLLLVLAAFVAGCENKYKDPDPQAMGYDYYPLEVGQYRVYAVKHVKHTNREKYTQQFQLRERVDTSFVDQTGQLVYKIILSKRLNDQSAWLDDSVMTVVKTASMVLLTKHNMKYVKLVFPVKSGLEFIGDIYNSRAASDLVSSKMRNGKEVFTYNSVGESYKVKDQTYANTATVVLSLMINSQINDNRFEVYALGIGLVHRMFNSITYESCRGDAECSGNMQIEKGYEREEILIEHGKL